MKKKRNFVAKMCFENKDIISKEIVLSDIDEFAEDIMKKLGIAIPEPGQNVKIPVSTPILSDNPLIIIVEGKESDIPRLNYEEEEWISAKICGFRCEFSDIRINKNSIPKGMYFYEVKAIWDELSKNTKYILTKNATTDFYGTIVIDHPMELDENGQLCLENGDVQIKW